MTNAMRKEPKWSPSLQTFRPAAAESWGGFGDEPEPGDCVTTDHPDGTITVRMRVVTFDGEYAFVTA